VTLEAKCPGCGAAFKDAAAFCAGCGRKRALVETEGVGFSIRFYLALLASQVLTMVLIKTGTAVFTALVFDTAAMALITVVTAGVHRRLVLPAYRRAGFGPLGYALIVVAAPLVIGVILGYVDGLAHAFGLPAPHEIEPFDGHGRAAMLGLIALAPPVFEELAFRGLIYGALAKSLRRSEAYLISSFAFAMLHLSVPALLTHLPLGLYFCWLRERSGSMYPSMFAHCCHNLGVVLVELNGWA
jgi:uncharacterized protein